MLISSPDKHLFPRGSYTEFYCFRPIAESGETENPNHWASALSRLHRCWLLLPRRQLHHHCIRYQPVLLRYPRETDPTSLPFYRDKIRGCNLEHVPSVHNAVRCNMLVSLHLFLSFRPARHAIIWGHYNHSLTTGRQRLHAASLVPNEFQWFRSIMHYTVPHSYCKQLVCNMWHVLLCLLKLDANTILCELLDFDSVDYA